MMPSRKSQQVVMRLFDAICDNDRERVFSFFTDQSVFLPPAQAPAIGYNAIWSALSASAARAEAVEHQLCQVAEGPDGSVQAERIERHLIDGVWRELRVTGVLAVNGCKITRWIDSCDAAAQAGPPG
jgi:limonene-1,2-epoxide hydrolase